MSDLNTLFLPVGSYCRRTVITGRPDDRLVDCAVTMQLQGISSLVICQDGAAEGILTDRDLRNKVVAIGLDPATCLVKDVMSSPLITIGEGEFLFEALHLLTKQRIHRLVVTDRQGKLAGIITLTDILKIQSSSPQNLIREIEEASAVEELKTLHQRVQELVGFLLGTGVRIRDLVRLIAYLNDRILLRLIHLLRSGQFSQLPDSFAFVVLGSEGRGEQTLTTDQDNALIYGDGINPAELSLLKDFSQQLIDSLIAIGVPSCPGGIMAKNDKWRRSLDQWRSVLDQWFTVSTPENILNVSMFADLRFLSGDNSLEQELQEYVRRQLVGHQAFLGNMTANLLRFKVPLGWFGRIKTEKGAHAGKVDIKKAGIFAITEGVKILSLAEGIQEKGTLQRMDRLVAEGRLDRPLAADLAAAFDSLVYLRLRAQVDAISAGRQPDNMITLDLLNRLEQKQLRTALEVVRSFQGLLERRFRPGAML